MGPGQDPVHLLVRGFYRFATSFRDHFQSVFNFNFCCLLIKCPAPAQGFRKQPESTDNKKNSKISDLKIKNGRERTIDVVSNRLLSVG